MKNNVVEIITDKKTLMEINGGTNFENELTELTSPRRRSRSFSDSPAKLSFNLGISNKCAAGLSVMAAAMGTLAIILATGNSQNTYNHHEH